MVGSRIRNKVEGNVYRYIPFSSFLFLLSTSLFLGHSHLTDQTSRRQRMGEPMNWRSGKLFSEIKTGNKDQSFLSECQKAMVTSFLEKNDFQDLREQSGGEKETRLRSISTFFLFLLPTSLVLGHPHLTDQTSRQQRMGEPMNWRSGKPFSPMNLSAILNWSILIHISERSIGTQCWPRHIFWTKRDQLRE